MSPSSEIQGCQGNITSHAHASLSGCAIAQGCLSRSPLQVAARRHAMFPPHTHWVLLVFTFSKWNESSALKSQQEMWPRRGTALWGLPGSWLTSHGPFSQSGCTRQGPWPPLRLPPLSSLAWLLGTAGWASIRICWSPFGIHVCVPALILPSLLANILAILLEGRITVQLMIAERLACALA